MLAIAFTALALALAGPLDGTPPGPHGYVPPGAPIPPPPNTGSVPTPVATNGPPPQPCTGSTSDPSAPQPPACTTGGLDVDSRRQLLFDDVVRQYRQHEQFRPARVPHGAPTIHVGEIADFYSSGVSNAKLCYQVGSSRVGCATSGTDWFHLLVRRGSTQYVTLRYEGKVVGRRVYRNVH